MSTAKRAYDVLRSYVNYGWDRVQGGDETDAERELRQAMEQPLPNSKPQTQDVPNTPKPVPMTLENARKLLGVDSNATTKQIDASYQEVIGVVDPAKFTVGTDAHTRAVELRAKFLAARTLLIANIDPTVQRFEHLEVE